MITIPMIKLYDHEEIIGSKDWISQNMFQHHENFLLTTSKNLIRVFWNRISIFGACSVVHEIKMNNLNIKSDFMNRICSQSENGARFYSLHAILCTHEKP